MKENVQKKLDILEGQKVETEKEKGKLVSSIVLMEKELSELKKQIVADRKIIEALNRERELVIKSTQKTAGQPRVHISGKPFFWSSS